MGLQVVNTFYVLCTQKFATCSQDLNTCLSLRQTNSVQTLLPYFFNSPFIILPHNYNFSKWTPSFSRELHSSGLLRSEYSPRNNPEERSSMLIFTSAASVTPHARKDIYRKVKFLEVGHLRQHLQHLTHLKNDTMYSPLFPQIRHYQVCNKKSTSHIINPLTCCKCSL